MTISSPEDDTVPPLPGWLKATTYIRIFLQWVGSLAVAKVVLQHYFQFLSDNVIMLIAVAASFVITALLLMLWQVQLRHRSIQALRDASWEVVMNERQYIDSHIDYIKTWESRRLEEFRTDLCDENVEYFDMAYTKNA